jgi:primosomal protein N' (replication factor Y)
MPDNIAHIALNSPLRSVFDYKTGGLSPVPGQRVEVPFGKRKAVGIVVKTSNESHFEKGELKAISRTIDDSQVLSSELLDFILWAARYYHHPTGEALFHALPARLRENTSIEHKDFLLWKTSTKGQLIDVESLGRAGKQKEALMILKEHPDGIGNKTCQSLGLSSQTLKALEKKELVVQFSPSTSPVEKTEKKHLLRTSALTLNEEQQKAYQAVHEKLNKYQCFLLLGITGSGKTEIYLQLIHEVLSQGKQALVLVPEIGLTPQTIQRFQQRFTCPVAVLHSGLSSTERFKNWYKCRQNQAGIIIGTRSAIFTDIPHLGLIIVDEEHDTSYKQQEGFRYSARDLAIVRAQKWKVPVLLGSATPSLESFYNSQNGRYELLKLNTRATNSPEPEIKVVDTRQQELQAGLSQKALQTIRRHLDQEQQVLVFINRRGYTPALICSECKWLATCPFCDARFTFHKQKNRLICHHCNHQQAPITTCEQCGAGEMHSLGQGTEKVEEMLAKHFKQTPIMRIDRDSTERKNALQERLAEIQKGKACILVGTQMLTKGHHFPRVTLVCILDADQGFFSADFRAMERMGQTLLQIIGRAGRESQHSEVVFQTELPDHPALNTLLEKGYAAFAQDILDERKVVNFPPFGCFCLIRADAPHLENSLIFLEEVKQILTTLTEHNSKILGPAPANMQKKAGRHRAQLILHSDNRAKMQNLLNSGIQQIVALKGARKVRWSIDVDPMDMF